MFETFVETIQNLWSQSAFCNITLEQGIMLLLSFFLMYLAIVKQYEPMLMLPIAFGMALTNLPGAGLYHPEYFLTTEIPYATVLHDGGILDVLYLGVKCGIFPPLIFLGIGCMTDFGPLIEPEELLPRRGGSGRYLLHIPRCVRALGYRNS